jgi:hypothetical protein
VSDSSSGSEWGDPPKADPSSRYHAILQESAERYPRTTEDLMRADRHRPRRWQQFIDPVDLQAIELLLDFLASASRTLQGWDGTRGIAFLSARVADDVRMSLESLLSGHLQLASDAMRDVLETELLVRDFALDTAQIARWLSADDTVIRNNFRPVHCRRRQARALGVNINDVPGATDYRAHSQILHVTETFLPALSPAAGHQAIHVLDAIYEIMFHGRSSVRAIADLLNATGHNVANVGTTLTALNDALADLDRAHSATEAMATRIAESVSPNERVLVWIFESGLAVSFNRDTNQAASYSISRTDFRRLHREVSPEHAASFEMRSLGDLEAAPAS